MSSYLRVQVAGEQYAIDVRSVREVGTLGDVTAVPGSSRPVLGLCTVRGSILPVIDLAAVFDRPGLGRPAQLAVIEATGQRAALAVDGLIGVGEPAGTVERSGADLLTGTFLDDGDLVGLVDIVALMAWVTGARR
ncbi:MAG: chemotaxis protein CheW [Streptosporangiaceae bacterium]